MNIKNIIYSILIVIFFIFIGFSILFNFHDGKNIGFNFFSLFIDMIKILPFGFILIGLFEVWINAETVKKHLGESSGLKGFFWAIVLSSLTIGSVVIIFPVAYSLYKKGAKLSVVLLYMNASCVCRIPMLMFEASYLGIKFSSIRLVLSIVLIIIFSIIVMKFDRIKS